MQEKEQKKLEEKNKKREDDLKFSGNYQFYKFGNAGTAGGGNPIRDQDG